MPAQECPHCFLRVFTSSAGICPSCRKDVNQVTENQRKRTSILVRGDSLFPPKCHRCNLPTTDVHKVTATTSWTSYNEDQAGILRLGLFILMFALLPVAFLFRKQGGWQRNYHEVVLRIPTCPDCDCDNIGVIESITETRQHRIAVDKGFAAEFRALNGIS